MAKRVQKPDSRPDRRKKPSGRHAVAAEPALLDRTPFVVAITLSAFLLFSLELLAGRLVLPVFGGAPAVWTTTLCFFTAALFLGYAYSHYVATNFSPSASGIIQVGLAIATVVLTLTAPTDVASLRVPALPTSLNVLVALTVIAGPAAFLLASTTPLLSAWYAGGRDAPWWLYAASNAASFAALIGYPLLISPLLSLSMQRLLLALGLAGYGILLAWTLIQVRRHKILVVPTDQAGTSELLTWRRQILWLFAAAVPAGLMSATSIFITTDLVAAPLIWIGPLGMYLASYVVAFSQTGRSMLRLAERMAPAAATLLWLPFMQKNWPVLPLLIIVNVALFVLAVAIHGRLALDRPAEGHLTRFYLMISLGGLLATAFVALLAPLLFSLIYEYPLLIAAGMVMLVLLPTTLRQPGRGLFSNPREAAADLVQRFVPYALAATIIYTGFSGDAATAERLAWLLLFGAAVVVVSVTPQVSSIVTLAAIELLIVISDTSPLLQERTFFGVTKVYELGSEHILYSGTTLHGLQFTDDMASKPTSYYSRTGPLGAIFNDLRSRTKSANIGVVGLGVGTVAAYAQAKDHLTFFELDSAVIDIARNPRYFTYLEKAAVAPKIVMGDGRLSLESEPPASFDLLILDAFNSDVVPAHLLTREAMQIYRKVLRPGGLLAMHLSSRFYNLPAAVGPTVRSIGLSTAGLQGGGAKQSTINQTGSTSALWVVVGSAEDMARFMARGWIPLPVTGPVLSDDHSDLTRLLLR